MEKCNQSCLPNNKYDVVGVYCCYLVCVFCTPITTLDNIDV